MQTSDSFEDHIEVAQRWVGKSLDCLPNLQACLELPRLICHLLLLLSQGDQIECLFVAVVISFFNYDLRLEYLHSCIPGSIDNSYNVKMHSYIVQIR